MESIIFVLLLLLPLSLSQSPPPVVDSPPPVPSPPPPSDDCNGVYLSYAHTATRRLPPLEDDPSRQPYRFESTATILNHDIVELKAWKLFVGFRHDEYLVSATNAVLADGKSVPGEVGNGTVFAGFPNGDLKTAVETAGDEEQMRVRIELVGTQFGVAEPDVPMPANISLAMDGFDCSNLTRQGSMMHVCCLRDEHFKANITEEEFLPRQYGDLTIDYDVLRSYESEYYARVKIANHHALGRLDYWQLSWDWMREEFINSMKGAHPTVGDSNGCVYGSQGEYYKDLDFSSVLSCEKRPTIVDLPVSRTNDSNVGMVPFCCRNGTILPNSMDPSKSISAFELQVKKMPPDLNKTALIPPQNWQINGTLNADYVCGPPVRVSPSQFPDPSGLPFNRTAVASWQVVCNITQPKNSSPKCCVSFSAFYNDSVIPCRTCACGCPRNSRQTCSATSPSLLLPPESLLVPFDNRTAKALAWADLKHHPIPDPLPCPDNCGVSINWHVFTDYSRGWTARVTLFNWGDTNFADWFAAMEFEKAVPGFERMYSFNGSALDSPNNTIFMQGLPGLNYLVAEQNGTNPDRDPRVPGKQQSVISFTKRRTPGIDVPAGDGFPTKVFFNGEECSLPTIFPSSNAHKTTTGAFMIFSLLLTLIATALMQQ